MVCTATQKVFEEVKHLAQAQVEFESATAVMQEVQDHASQFSSKLLREGSAADFETLAQEARNILDRSIVFTHTQSANCCDGSLGVLLIVALMSAECCHRSFDVLRKGFRQVEVPDGVGEDPEETDRRRRRPVVEHLGGCQHRNQALRRGCRLERLGEGRQGRLAPDGRH